MLKNVVESERNIGSQQLEDGREKGPSELLLDYSHYALNGIPSGLERAVANEGLLTGGIKGQVIPFFEITAGRLLRISQGAIDIVEGLRGSERRRTVNQINSRLNSLADRGCFVD